MLHLVSCGVEVDIRGICMINIFVISLEKRKPLRQLNYTLAPKIDNFTGGHVLGNMEERMRSHAWRSLEVDRTSGLKPF